MSILGTGGDKVTVEADDLEVLQRERDSARKEAQGWEDEYEELIGELMGILGGGDGVDDAARSMVRRAEKAEKLLGEATTLLTESKGWYGDNKFRHAKVDKFLAVVKKYKG